MRKLSEVLINVVKNYDPNKTKAVCLCASHKGTSGATLQTKDKHGFTCEEDVFRTVVREAVDQLNREGWTKVDQAGIDEHEMDLSYGHYSAYDVVISNHFDTSAPAGRKATLYTNEGLANQLNGIRNMITGRIGIANAPIAYRDDLYMTGMSNCVLFEWFDARDEFDVNALLSEVGDNQPTPPPVDPVEPPTGDWKADAIGRTYGDEKIEDIYEETGTFTYNNVPHALSIYPDFPQALKDEQADPNVFMVNGDAFSYWCVVRTDKHDYLIYNRSNGHKGCVSIRNRQTGQAYGYAE